ncbi:hypothetical protein HK100_003726 [Physocladia obscura]|uniref:Uncharacterized protein n=1 Tax=Physocladia obscura TaxID=109957 RepID=A0AAD5SZQ7_9FUNG|nr:hypothetical protein HK100_003726 [Physocladia obscura]
MAGNRNSTESINTNTSINAGSGIELLLTAATMNSVATAGLAVANSATSIASGGVFIPPAGPNTSGQQQQQQKHNANLDLIKRRPLNERALSLRLQMQSQRNMSSRHQYSRGASADKLGSELTKANILQTQPPMPLIDRSEEKIIKDDGQEIIGSPIAANDIDQANQKQPDLALQRKKDTSKVSASVFHSPTDPETIQDAKDLAAFTAWVTLRLIGRRWSLLMEQKSISSTISAAPAVSSPTLNISSASTIQNLNNYSTFTKNIPASSFTPAPLPSIPSYAPKNQSFSKMSNTDKTNYQFDNNLIPHQAYNNYNNITGPYRDRELSRKSCDSISTASTYSRQYITPEKQKIPAIAISKSDSMLITERVDSTDNQINAFGIPDAPTMSSPSSYDDRPGSIPPPLKHFDSLKTSLGSNDSLTGQLNSLKNWQSLPSLNELMNKQEFVILQRQNLCPPIPSILPAKRPHPEQEYPASIAGLPTTQNVLNQSRSQSYHYPQQFSANTPNEIPPLQQLQHQITQTPNQTQPTTKHTLPPAYISHYTSRLTRLATLSLLKTPTPPHTTLLGLHLLRRLISTPKPLPTRISTPTRMLLGCLMVADALFGGERGVPSRMWAAIAKVSGLRDSGEDVTPTAPPATVVSPPSLSTVAADGKIDGDGVFIAGIKKDVLESLEFNLYVSFVGYEEWIRTLKDLLKDDEVGGSGGGGGAAGRSGVDAVDMRIRTRRILDELSVGEGRLGLGWKW